jgi:hypothetical protein
MTSLMGAPFRGLAGARRRLVPKIFMARAVCASGDLSPNTGVDVRRTCPMRGKILEIGGIDE